MASRPWYEGRLKTVVSTAPEVETIVSTKDARCPSCGIKYDDPEREKTWGPGFWPFCKGNQEDHRLTHSFSHDSFEVYFDEHITPGGGSDFGLNYQGERVQGTFIDGRGTRNQLMKKYGLEAGKNSHKRSSKLDHEKVANQVAETAFREWKERSGR